MKQTRILIPLVSILLLASTVTPALATKEKIEKVEYTLAGRIWDRDKGIGGIMSLTFSGRVAGTPDYAYKDSWAGPGEDYWDSYWEEYWSEGVVYYEYYKAEVYMHHEARWTESYTAYEARWYGPQSTYNGKLVVIWDDGSTTTFRVDLSPLWIEKFAREGTSEGEATDSYRRLIYRLTSGEEKEEVWEFVREETDSYSWTWSYIYAYSTLSIGFSGKIQSKGRPPLKGAFFLWDYKSRVDGWEYHSISVSGQFGPYQIFGGAKIIPA